MTDVVERAKPFLALCGSCDAGLPMQCTCPDGDYRPVMAALVAEIERLRAPAISIRSHTAETAPVVGRDAKGGSEPADSFSGGTRPVTCIYCDEPIQRRSGTWVHAASRRVREWNDIGLPHDARPDGPTDEDGR